LNRKRFVDSYRGEYFLHDKRTNLTMMTDGKIAATLQRFPNTL